MNTDHKEGKYRVVTEGIIKVFYKVYNTLGYGFLEKVYENAIVVELKREGIHAIAQAPIKVLYEGHVVGEYFADILVDDTVIVEIKAVKQLAPEHEAQLLNYLKATNIEVGLLINFGTRPEVKRKILDNYRK
jgi:GxxExxY protein